MAVEKVISVNLRVRKDRNPELYEYLKELSLRGERTAYVKKAVLAYFRDEDAIARLEKRMERIEKFVEEIASTGVTPRESPEELSESAEKEAQENLLNGMDALDEL